MSLSGSTGVPTTSETLIIVVVYIQAAVRVCCGCPPGEPLRSGRGRSGGGRRPDGQPTGGGGQSPPAADGQGAGGPPAPPGHPPSQQAAQASQRF